MNFYTFRKLQQSQKVAVNRELGRKCNYNGFLVLDCICDGIDQSFLIAEASGLHPSAVSCIVTKLLSKKFIKGIDSEGAKTRKMAMTQAGWGLHNRATEAVNKAISAVKP